MSFRHPRNLKPQLMSYDVYADARRNAILKYKCCLHEDLKGMANDFDYYLSKSGLLHNITVYINTDASDGLNVKCQCSLKTSPQQILDELVFIWTSYLRYRFAGPHTYVVEIDAIFFEGFTISSAENGCIIAFKITVSPSEL